ncbi:hypothetical protein HanIR_Chr03g0128081 [Helianthus annuus]|nr:hypothetical protein HanIR_Chr03g0128081 [Helianthus annuus]
MGKENVSLLKFTPKIMSESRLLLWVPMNPFGLEKWAKLVRTSYDLEKNSKN